MTLREFTSGAGMAKRVSTVLSDEQHKFMLEIAEGHGMTPAQLLRHALSYYVENEISLPWPDAEMEHGGKRERSGRRPKEKRIRK